MGLIDRQAAIEAARKAKDKSEAHRLLVQIPFARQWIPVSERLPKKVDNYLVTTNSGQIARYIFMGDWASKDYWMRYVVAWMPLPAPYRPEGDRDNVHKPD